MVIAVLVAALGSPAANAATAPAIRLPEQLTSPIERSALSEFYVAPTRIVWTSGKGVSGTESLLKTGAGQANLTPLGSPTTLVASAPDEPASILVDFGAELHGFVELFTPASPDQRPRPVRIRFGESASEAMSEPGVKGAQNDHAMRDVQLMLPWLGKARAGPTGFRFVRIDALDPTRPVSLDQIRAVLVIRDIPQVGAFRCSDERLNRIWQVGAYTVHLTMQDYLWDGIKRDRLVWVGDMHPEVNTINAVFGFNEVVPRSLDLVRDRTPPDQWMNTISSYSLWWVLIHEQWWLHHGDRSYLEAQAAYLQQLLQKLTAAVGADGREQLDGTRFLDWPTSTNPQAVTAGLQALLVLALEAGERLSRELGDTDTAGRCAEAVLRARPVVPDPNGSKAAAALQVLARQRDAKATAAGMLGLGGITGISSFYGYYVLNALARAGEIETALRIIREYWGAMLDRGATTFWEDLDPAWLEGSGRIDELPSPGQRDLHGDHGAYCYVGFRHSLCHGWASGPTAWLSEHVLGVVPLAPGCSRLRVSPQLGDLSWAEGSYPTPRGPVRVRHDRQPDGSVRTQVTAPAGIEIVQDPAIP